MIFIKFLDFQTKILIGVETVVKSLNKNFFKRSYQDPVERLTGLACFIF